MSEQTMTNNAITIRRLDGSDADRDALARLAQRDSGRFPAAPVIGVEVEGQLLAARSLSSGETIADPFSRTDELGAMLELRALQLSRRERGSRLGLRVPRRRAAVAVGGSPPGSIAALPR